MTALGLSPDYYKPLRLASQSLSIIKSLQWLHKDAIHFKCNGYCVGIGYRCLAFSKTPRMSLLMMESHHGMTFDGGKLGTHRFDLHLAIKTSHDGVVTKEAKVASVVVKNFGSSGYQLAVDAEEVGHIRATLDSEGVTHDALSDVHLLDLLFHIALIFDNKKWLPRLAGYDTRLMLRRDRTKEEAALYVDRWWEDDRKHDYYPCPAGYLLTTAERGNVKAMTVQQSEVTWVSPEPYPLQHRCFNKFANAAFARIFPSRNNNHDTPAQGGQGGGGGE